VHPLARPNTTEKLNGVSPGQRVILWDGRRGVLDQSTGVGGYFTLDDGTHVFLGAGQISPETGPPEGLEIPEPNKWPEDFTLRDGEYQPTREPWEI
jgi:hypothetical protein